MIMVVLHLVIYTFLTMKTFKRTSLPDFIKYNNKTYALEDETSKSIRVEVLSRNLIGVLDNNGFAYKPSVFYFNPVKINCPCCNGEGFFEDIEPYFGETIVTCSTCNGSGTLN